MEKITRRLFLRTTAAAGAVGATISAPAVVDAAVSASTPEDLTRYYAFLWTEFKSLSDEMGVDICDSFTAHRNGDVAAVKAQLTDRPSTRAKAVLKIVGADRDCLASTPFSSGTHGGPSAEERARHHFAEFAKAMDELTAGADGWAMNGGARGDAMLRPVPSREPWFIAKAVHHVEEPIMPDGRAIGVHVKGGTEFRTHMLVTRHREVMRTDY